MQIEQRWYVGEAGWQARGAQAAGAQAQLVLAFGGRAVLADPARLAEIRARYPAAHIVLSSTSGEILGGEVSDERLTTTAIYFEATRVAATCITTADVADSFEAGQRLAGRLAGPGLVHVFVVSDGQQVNGGELAEGFNRHLPAGTLVTGGLAGDGDRFEETVVGLNEPPAPGRIVAVGCYGDRLQVGCGVAGGWVPFGPARRVTRADGNRLFELDGHSALALYRRYLGEQADGLPGAALRFPLSLRTPAGHHLVRTILSIDEAEQSMTFAGDIPAGGWVRFMRASYEDLVEGAARAAEASRAPADLRDADLALCVSCVGRKIVLGQRVEEETEAVRDVLGPRTAIAGFYSYGELAPLHEARWCALHNQTMTITTLKERG